MIPKNCLYSRSHEWVRKEDGYVFAGITHFAQEQLGDITFVELPQVGKVLQKGDEMGVVESVKAASEIYAPVSGEVVEVNTELDNAPELINQDPFGRGWIVKLKSSAPLEDLLGSEEYAKLIQG